MGRRFRARARPEQSASIRSIAASPHKSYALIHRYVLGLLDQGMAADGLSYGTAYRPRKALEALDVVRYDRGGWLLVSRQLKDESADQCVQALIAYIRKRIGDLIDYRFDPARAADFYIRGRPDYVPIGD